MTLRQAAIAEGHKHYFTGKPCKRGHVAKRLVSTNVCTTCAQEATRANSAYFKAHHAANRDAKLAQMRAYREANPEKMRTLKLAWKAARPDHAKGLVSDWKRANRDRVNVDCAARRAAKGRATPAWANRDLMRDFYATADGLNMLTGEWHHVDHIVPLLGKTVCGLHVEANLCVLSAADNMAKGNRAWPDMP